MGLTLHNISAEKKGKYQWHQEQKGKSVCRSTSSLNGYLAMEGPSIMASRPFDGLRISVTGIPHDEREAIRQLILSAGGVYEGELNSARCTHLVLADATVRGRKCALGKVLQQSGRLKCVGLRWLYASYHTGRKLDEERFPPPEHESDMRFRRVEPLGEVEWNSDCRASHMASHKGKSEIEEENACLVAERDAAMKELERMKHDKSSQSKWASCMSVASIGCDHHARQFTSAKSALEQAGGTVFENHLDHSSSGVNHWLVCPCQAETRSASVFKSGQILSRV